jgi:hypothetical protein
MSGQSGRIIGTIAGAALAYFTGGASYVALGATLGGAVGSLLDPKQKIEGPRLEDLKVQVSTYGIGIPKLYGTERFGGNVIWSTDKLELPFVTSQGKGGGGTENTNYRYFVHMRQLLCETPRDGSTVSIIKIFQDGKLIWDISAGIPIGSALATAENLYAGFILYQGHQDQLPNPEEESWTGGPGTASAYRGVVSIYMRAIECPGGRVPQFSFVLSSSAARVDDIQVGDEFVFPKVLSAASRVGIGSPTIMFGQTFGSTLTVGAIGHDYGTITASNTAVPSSSAPTQGDADEDFMLVHQNAGVLGASALVFIDSQGKQATSFGVDQAFRCDGGVNASWSKRGDYFAFGGQTFVGGVGGPDMIYVFQSGGPPVGSCSISGLRKVLLTDNRLWVEYAGTIELRALDSSLTLIASATKPTMGTSEVARLAYGAQDTLKIVLARNTQLQLWSSVLTGSVLTFEKKGDVTRPDFSIPYPLVYPVRVDGLNVYGLHVTEQSGGSGEHITYEPVYILMDQLQVSEVKAKDIIADQIELSGATSYDVSTLPDSDTVYGYKIAGPASARANIEPILTAFGYYVVDEDGKIKVKRYADITSVATITFDELGQVEDGGESADAMPLTRTQEIDLPSSVTVSYIEPTNDFQTASERDERQVTDATEDLQIQLPVCISSDKAKKVAQMALYDAWRRQNQRSLTVSRKFAAVSPGDGVTVEYPRGTFKLWLVLSTNDTGAVCEWAVVPGDAAIFTQTAIGATGYSQQQVSPLPPPSSVVLLDMPILRDADNDAGKYAAIAPYGESGWRGTSLLVSDDDLNYIDKGSVTSSAVTGIAESVLGDPAGNFSSIDHRSTVIVNVGSGELNSTTWDLLYGTGRVNLAALMSNFTVDGFPDAKVELFQFRVASSLGGGRYVLSEMVRGLYGTERVAYNHGLGDTFVLLNASGMLRVAMEPGDIGSTKFYKAVSLGLSADAVSSVSSLTAGYGLRPLSPINVKLDRTPSDGSIVFTWGRRTRMSHNALRQIMPMGETSERYEVVIYTDSSYQVVRRVYPVYAPTFTYAAAALALDGNSQLGSIFFRIYQISDAVGRGVPFQPGQGIQ